MQLRVSALFCEKTGLKAGGEVSADRTPRIWWSWGDLNPRPQIFLAQIYMFSVLFCVSSCKPRRRTLIAGPAPLFLACAQGARKQASR